MEIVLISGLILGLTSNFHCLGMCGPIALILPVNRKNNWTILFGTLQYNLGRITTYAVLGILFGMIGLTINVFGFLQWISIIAGIGLVIFAWRKHLNAYFPRLSNPFGIQKGIQKLMGWTMKSNSPFKLVLFGAINGLLPCGMVYVALLNALLVDDLMSSAFAMIAFGIGTLPAMIAVPFTANKMGAETRRKMNRAVPYLLTVVGLLVILRGMNLGIPFISPSIAVKQPTEIVSETSSPENESEITMECCHKPAGK